ncbi:hypothetical protein BKA93DRAFT_541186 [Sparassis latifolia]
MCRGLPLFPSFLPFTLVLTLIRRTSGEGVTWQSPSAGDVYASGDTIVGQWSAAQSVVSPSFSLCALQAKNVTGPGGGTCGSRVWPTVDQSDGSPRIYLSLPNVSSPSQFYLQLKDDFGNKADSPLFSLNPASPDENTDDSVPATTTSLTAVSTDSIANTKSSGGSSSNTVSSSSTGSPVSSSGKSASRSGNVISHGSSVVSPTASSPTSSTSAVLASDIIPSLPNFDEARMPSPTVAYALPLSVVVSVLLIAGILSVHHRRKLRNECLQEKQAQTAHALSRQSSASGSTSTRTLVDTAPRPYPPSLVGWIRSSSRSTKTEHVPALTGDRSPSIKRQPRRMTREPFYTDTGRRRNPTRVPAGVFRAAVSPVPPAPSKFDLDDELDEDRDLNASVNESVVSRYFHSSPIPPPSPTPPFSPSEVVIRPEMAHVRRCAGAEVNKPLPASPADAELYDAVVHKLSKLDGARGYSRR